MEDILEEIQITKKYKQYQGFKYNYSKDIEQHIATTKLEIDYTIFPYQAYQTYSKLTNLDKGYKVNLDETLKKYNEDQFFNYIIYN